MKKSSYKKKQEGYCLEKNQLQQRNLSLCGRTATTSLQRTTTTTWNPVIKVIRLQV
jgi:hypothetical protein